MRGGGRDTRTIFATVIKGAHAGSKKPKGVKSPGSCYTRRGCSLLGTEELGDSIMCALGGKPGWCLAIDIWRIASNFLPFREKLH